MRLTLVVSLVVAAIDAVMGMLIAWVLVRDDFRGKALVNAPDRPAVRAADDRRRPRRCSRSTARRARSGSTSPTRRPASRSRCCSSRCRSSCGPCSRCCIGLDREAEQAAASLGAGPIYTFRRIILPALRPAILAGVALAFGRAVGEFGAIVLISGNIPFKTEVASVFVYGRIESGATTSAAAVSVLLLAISFVLLLGISCLAPAEAERGDDRGRLTLRVDRARLPRRCCSWSRSGWSSTARSRTGSARPGTP